MRLEPIYLLGPDPKPEPNPPRTHTRRAVLAGGIVGLLTGTAITVFARGRTDDAQGAARTPPVDTELAWALEVGEGPIERLLERHQHFLLVVWSRGTESPRLWHGAERMILAVLEHDAGMTPELRRGAASLLVQTLESYAPPPHLLRHLAPLRSAAR
jgi:hypothetical protein